MHPNDKNFWPDLVGELILAIVNGEIQEGRITQISPSENYIQWEHNLTGSLRWFRIDHSGASLYGFAFIEKLDE